VGGLHRLQAIGPLDREYQREEVAIMTTSRWIYIHTVLHLYVNMPNTPGRICSHDRRLAEQWFIRQIPIPIVEMALLLGVIRRFRRADAFQLAPIRSMAYFRPVVEELMAQPPPPTYIHYLRYKLGFTPNINTG
jgi:hypothetical protein